MTNTAYRDGVNAGYLVVRRIKMLEVDEAELATALATMDALFGVQSVSYNEKRKVIKVAYDGSRTDIDQLLQIIDHCNVPRVSSWWQTRKLNQYRFVDQNVKDNAKHVHVCCSKPPPELASRFR